MHWCILYMRVCVNTYCLHFSTASWPPIITVTLTSCDSIAALAPCNSVFQGDNTANVIPSVYIISLGVLVVIDFFP